MIKRKNWLLALFSLLFAVSFLLAGFLIFDKDRKAMAEAEVPAYYVTSENSSVRYGAFDLFSGTEGLAATLKSGDSLVLRSIIDLKELDETDKLLEVMVVPNTLGAVDATVLNIRIVDAFDSTNYVNVQVKPYNTTEDVVYMLANASNGQKPSGLDRGGLKWHVDKFGTWVHGNFAGQPKPAFGVNGNLFGVSFDFDTNSVYAYEKNSNEFYLIADLDDEISFPRKAWNGFTTGEVYFELEFEGYTASTANLLVTNTVAGISSSTVQDSEGPIITTDTLGYAENDLPKAVVGERYSLFDATAHDLYSGECKVIRKVYTNYYSENKGLIASYDYFVPQVPDTHYVVYMSADGQNNMGVKVLKIDVLSQPENMSFTYGPHENEIQVGNLYTIPTYTVEGGSGDKEITITAMNGNIPLTITNGTIRPVVNGSLEIKYTACDYLGMEYSETITVQVTSTNKASFIEEPILPRSFINGNSYQLPIVNAYNFVNGNGAPVNTVIKVKENGKTRTLDGNAYTPSVQNSGDEIAVSYVATIEGEETIWTKNIPVYKVREENGDLKMDSFFLTDMSKKTTSEGVCFTTERDACIDFINPVTALGFNVGFYIDKTSKFSKVNIYLTDFVDKNNVLKFTYFTQDGTTTFYINDGELGYPVKEDIMLEELVKLTYNDSTQQVVADNISGSKVLVEKNLAGETFNGFAQRTVYIRMELEGVTASTILGLESICGQYFYNETRDWIAPVVYIDGPYGGEFSINTTATLYRPFAMDVLDGEVSGTFTVKDPSGNIVTDIYNNRLENSAFVETKINLTQYGTYIVTFYASDTAGNISNTFAYTLSVPDEVAPVLQVSGVVASKVKVGDTVGLPTATATDNYDAKLNVQIMVIDPVGHTSIISVNTGKYQITRVGTYIFCYFTQDATGNMAYVNQVVTVEG